MPGMPRPLQAARLQCNACHVLFRARRTPGWRTRRTSPSTQTWRQARSWRQTGLPSWQQWCRAWPQPWRACHSRGARTWCGRPRRRCWRRPQRRRTWLRRRSRRCGRWPTRATGTCGTRCVWCSTSCRGPCWPSPRAAERAPPRRSCAPRPWTSPAPWWRRSPGRGQRRRRSCGTSASSAPTAPTCARAPSAPSAASRGRCRGARRVAGLPACPHFSTS